MVDETAQEAISEDEPNVDQESTLEDVNETTTIVEEAADADESTEQESDDSNENDADDDSDDDALVPISKLRKVRNEAKNLRERLREAEAKLTERDDSTLQSQLDSLMNELRSERLANALTSKVSDAGAIDPEILVGLVHLDSIEWEGNTPTNLDGITTELKEKYPKQFRSARGEGNVGARNDAKPSLEGLTAEQKLKMAYEKIS